MVKTKHQFNIFFSWQSDITDNKRIIRKGIDNACKKIKQSKGYDIYVDEATRDTPGAPNIPETIKSKIERCDVFIADITPITKKKGKQYPNSNVIYELGYASRCMEFSRIIIVAKEGRYNDNDLPFDINHERIGKFGEHSCNLDFEIGSSIKYLLDNGKFQYVKFFNDSLLKQNIRTYKYLPEVFLEDRKFKEYLRYFVSPYVFYAQVYSAALKLNFDYYNYVWELNGRKPFDFSISSFSDSLQGLNFSESFTAIGSITDYLKGKVSELENYGNNMARYAENKIEEVIKGFECCKKRVCLIKGKAGQGKTNVICDLVENVLLKRNIPFVYLNGFGIDANNIGNCISRVLYPEENYSFGDLLKYIKRFCIQQNKPFIIIIDGLNEYENSSLLKNNLQQILGTILDYDFVKLIVTCRTEYYNANYADLFVAYQDSVIEYESYSRLDENDTDTLIDNYRDYFKVAATFTDDIKRQFSNNLLLLRIFSEANKNKNLGFVNHLRKDILFSAYYGKTVETLANNITGARQDDIKCFMRILVELMLEKNIFANISLDDILDKLSTVQKSVFYQFLDSNILIKRELSGKLFNNEVVAFTFDEFRDFMISHYLVDVIFEANNQDSFKKYITQYTNKDHVLREGIICFLYCYSKEANLDVLNVIQKMDWYNEAFIKYIWEIEEEKVDENDIELLKQLILEDPNFSKKLISIERLNTIAYKKLNINILISILIKFTDIELEKFIDTVWPINDGGILHFNRRENSRDKFVKIVEDVILLNSKITKICKHSILQLLMFIAPFSFRAKSIIKNYYPNENAEMSDFINQIKMQTKSKKLKTFIERL